MCCLVSLSSQAGWLSDLTLPRLTDAQKEWHIDDFPLSYSLAQVSGHGYKMIETLRQPEWKSANGRASRPAYDAVRWGWKVEVKNTSAIALTISVTYELLDCDGFVVTTAYGSGRAQAGQITTIQGTADYLHYDQLSRVSKSSIKISF